MRVLTNRLFQVFRRLDGSKFHAYLTQPPLSQTKNKLLKRVLMVKQPSFVVEGDVVIAPNGQKMILMLQPDNFESLNSFQVAHVTESYIWERPRKILDPVAQVYRGNGLTPMGQIYTSIEHMDDLSLEQMVVHQYQFLTGQDVQPGDLVDGKQVQTTRKILGVNLVELK